MPIGSLKQDIWLTRPDFRHQTELTKLGSCSIGGATWTGLLLWVTQPCLLRHWDKVPGSLGQTFSPRERVLWIGFLFNRWSLLHWPIAVSYTTMPTLSLRQGTWLTRPDPRHRIYGTLNWVPVQWVEPPELAYCCELHSHAYFVTETRYLAHEARPLAPDRVPVQ